MEPFDIDLQNFIKLEGISGVFNTLDSNFRVRFFSTYANAREANYAELLDELKPMRERLSINQIRNIDQVLQRDLDDFRIANGLVPYLINFVNNISDPNHLAFFPAILGVLMPKDYLVKSIEKNGLEGHPLVDYPDVKGTDKFEEKVYTYAGTKQKKISWRITNLKNKDSGRVSPLSMLEFDKNLTEVLVLDGQHRANAFRVASGKFFTNRDNEIYRPYYKDIRSYPDDIETNLPVTLICFEKINKEANIIPDFITRRLFIDVNNNAKRITLSRQVLLDDRDPSSLLTNTFYSDIAENYGFSTNSNNLSLIHLGFDINSSLRDRQKNCVLNISNPELLNFTFDWFFFGTRLYNNLQRYEVGAEKKVKWNPDILSELLPNSRPLFDRVRDEELNEVKILTDPRTKDVVKEEFKDLFFEPFYTILNGVNFLKCHYNTTTIIQTGRDSGAWSSKKQEVWDEVFIGGEGLYYSFKNLLAIDGNPTRTDLIPIETAIKEIEDEFKQTRANLCGLALGDSEALFNSFNSLAFQVALFMGFYDFLELTKVDLADRIELKNASLEYIDRINTISVSIWSNVFTKIRPHLFATTDPKKWPSYHKLILRLIQQPGEYFDNASYLNHSPEAKIFRSKFSSQFYGYLSANYNEGELNSLTADDFKASHDDEIDAWKKIAMADVDGLFTRYLSTSCLRFDVEFISDEIIDNKLQ